MEEEEDISPQQTEKLIQFQDLTGIEDMGQCKELLKSNNWDLEVSVQHHLVQQVFIIEYFKMEIQFLPPPGHDLKNSSGRFWMD